MIKLTSIKREQGNKAEITAFADAKDEVTAGMSIVGLQYGIEPSMGYNANNQILAIEGSPYENA